MTSLCCLCTVWQRAMPASREPLSRRSSIRREAALTASLLLLTTNLVLAEPHVFSVGTVNGTEIVWERTVNGTTQTVQLTTNTVDDVTPQLCANASVGKSVVAFRRDGSSPGLRYILRDDVAETWGQEEGLTTESALNPSCAITDEIIWLAFEIPGNAFQERRVAVAGLGDCPGPNCQLPSPLPYREFDTGQRAAATFPVVHGEAGKAWIEWCVDNAMSYVVANPELPQIWGEPQTIEVQPGESVEDARLRVRDLVLEGQ